MTKYILHGGAAGRVSEKNRQFVLEVVKDIPAYGNILVVLFARAKDLWVEKFTEIQKTYSDIALEKKLQLALASEEVETFREELQNADAIYLVGGDTLLLKKYLDAIPDIENLWSGKTVAGSSAGSLVLSKYFYSGDYDACYEGLGILDIKMICHYSEERELDLQKLENFGEKMEILKLEEEEFVVIEK